MRDGWRGLLAGALAATGACSSGPTGPAELDTKSEQCANCRMAVSDPRFASQLVAPREVPRFFDDLGCLAEAMSEPARLPPRAVAWVADHRTKAWVRADRAVFTRVPGLETPMGSQLVAHADPASRDADGEARGGNPIEARVLFGPAGPPSGDER